MKKVVLSLFLLLVLGQSVFAAGIGYVDYAYIYKNSPVAKKILAQMETKAQEVRKYNLATKQQVAAQKTQEAKVKVRNDRQAGLTKLEKEYLELRSQLDLIMKAKVKVASTTILNQKKLDMIVDSRFTIAGGIDCTQEVLKAIK